ncbi:MAG: hypothetical protein HY456_01515 [Parcubacteria group bacterium]|nr:hypothetical protein [Parcubacteria group bacterium]
MKITDLTGGYIKTILKKQSPVEYEAALPELFKHYFQYWADRKYFYTILKEKEVAERTAAIIARLPHIEREFNGFGLPTDKLQIVLFVGQNCTNGHALRYKKEFMVWLPIEAYKTAKESDVFITHEIVHAIHYSAVPEFYFKTISEKYSMARQLITEGLATYLSMQMAKIDEKDALWADYLPIKKRNEWFEECKKKEAELSEFALKNFYRENREFFESNDPKDLYRYRGGYYVGLKTIGEIARERNMANIDLLKLPRDQFEELAIASLQSRR